MVKHYSKKALKKAIRSPIRRFLKAFVKVIGKVSGALSKRGGILRTFGIMLSSWKIAKHITAFLANAAFNKFCSKQYRYCSINRWFNSGFLDILVGNKKLNNKICTIKLW